MRRPRYPEDRSPLRAKLAERDEHFAALREEFLLRYRFNTARAYWGDLEHMHEWAIEHGKDPLALTNRDLQRYCALLHRLGYSQHTVRRRRSTYRLFLASVFCDES